MKEKKRSVLWHPAFLSGLKIELDAYRDFLSFEEEYPLNTKGRRIDIFITKAEQSPPIRSPIGAFFRHYNLIDYKGPSESMNIRNFHKVLSYAYSLPDHFHSDYILSETTVTLACHRFPVKLLRYIREEIIREDNIPLANIIPGLYHIPTDRIYPFPIQLAVLPQLPPEEYLWLHCLSGVSLERQPLEELREGYAKHMEDPVYQTIMNTIIRANLKRKGDAERMCEALYELFADELIKMRNDGEKAGEERGIKIGEERGEERGEKRGIKIGEERGEERGEEMISDLVLKLISDNRSADIERMASDSSFRASLIKQYHLG